MAKLKNKQDTKFIMNISTIISAVIVLSLCVLVIILYTNGTFSKWFNDGKYYVSTLKNGATVEGKLLDSGVANSPQNVIFKNPDYIVFYGDNKKDVSNLKGNTDKRLSYFEIDGDKVGVLMTPEQLTKFDSKKTYYFVLKDSILFKSKDKEGIKKLKEKDKNSAEEVDNSTKNE